MEIKFLFKTEFSFIGTEESAVCGMQIGGRTVAFTGDCTQVEKFGITAEEMALFAAKAESVHFESERVCVPVRGTGLNNKTMMEEISILTVRAIAHGEVVNTANLSRVVSRWWVTAQI